MTVITTVSENFDTLFFTESFFGQPIIEGTSISVPIRDVLPVPQHPLAHNNRALAGRFVFKGVRRSTRTIFEYIGAPPHPDGFREPYVVEDVDPPHTAMGTAREYGFEGRQESPKAFVDWVIWASSFEFVVERFDCHPLLSRSL